MLTMRVLFLLTALLFAVGGIAQSQVLPPTPSKSSHNKKSHPDQSTQNARPPDGNSDKTPVSVTLDSPVTIQKSDRDHNDEREEHQNKASNDWWLVIATIVLACATVILAGITGFLAKYTYKLWWSTNTLATDAKTTATQQATDMQTSMATAKQSADASMDMVATMERNARKELRAYVGVAKVHIENGNGGDHHGIFVIKNFGKTMAKATVIRISGTMVLGGTTDCPLGDENIKSKTVVMPSESLGGIEQAIKPMKERDSRIYLWGQIDYVDVFGVTHWTKFRFIDYRKTFAVNGFHTGWDVKTCDEGNEADDK